MRTLYPPRPAHPDPLSHAPSLCPSTNLHLQSRAEAIYWLILFQRSLSNSVFNHTEDIIHRKHAHLICLPSSEDNSLNL